MPIRYKCPKCGEEYTNQYDWAKHCQDVHKGQQYEYIKVGEPTKHKHKLQRLYIGKNKISGRGSDTK